MIAVLGRGNSLKKYAKMSYLFDTLYICGRFHKEIKKIGVEHFKQKRIIHVVSRGPCQLESNYYNILSVKYIQTASHSIKKQFCKEDGKKHSKRYPKNMELRKTPSYMRKRGYPPLSCDVIEKFSRYFNDYKDLCIFLEKQLPKKIKQQGESARRTRYWPTTGVYGVDLALNKKKINKIYLFGIDLYTTLTYSIYRTLGEEFSTSIDTGRTRLGIYHVSQLVKEFSSVEFFSVTKSKKFNFKYNNWHLIK